MRKNVASQKIGCQMVSASDGSAFTGSVTVSVTGDAGTQATGSVGSGACTHEGNGYHTYAPAQAETNYDLVAFTFTGTGAIPSTVQVYTLPTTGILAPTVADRTLDVSAGGEAGVDWANVGSPTTTLALTGTTIATTQKVDIETIKTNPVVNAGTVTFPTTATLASTTNITAGTITTATNVTTVNGLAANVITAASMAADASAEIADAVWDEDATAHQTQGTFGQAIGDPAADTNSIFKAVVTDATGATVGVDVAAVLDDTGTAGVVVASLAAGSITAAAIATGAIDADALAADAGTELGTAVWASATRSLTSLSGLTVDTVTTLTNLPAITANWLTAAGIADGAIDRATFAADTGLQAIRSNTAQAGASTTITLDASASATNDYYLNCNVYITGGTGVGQVREILGYVGATKVATVRAWATNPDNTSTFAILPAVSVWDDITASHLTSGSTGNALNAAGSAGDPWSTSLPGAYGAGSAGYILGTNLDAAISSRGTSTLTQTQVTGGAYALNSASFAFNAALDFTTTQKAATLARVTLTDTATTLTNLPAITANWLTAAGTAADFGTEVGAAVLSALGTGSWATSLAPASTALSTAVWTAPPTGFLAATFPATVASTTNITAGTITTVTNLTNAPTAGDLTSAMKASVNTEVLDVLNTDTFAQPSGVPGATVTLAEKIGRLYQALTSELTTTATALTFYSFGGAALWKKTVADDGTTYSETDATTP